MHDKTDIFAWGLWEQNSYVVHDLTLTNYLTHCGWWRVWGWGGLISVWGGCGQGRRERRDVTSVRSDSVRSGRSISRRRGTSGRSISRRRGTSGRSISRRQGTSGCCGSSCIRSAIVWKTRYYHSENGLPIKWFPELLFGGPPGAYFAAKYSLWTFGPPPRDEIIKTPGIYFHLQNFSLTIKRNSISLWHALI